MDVFWDEFLLGVGDPRQIMRVVIRLLAATILGAIVGLEREKAGKPAGLRTNTLVCLGTAIFIIVCSEIGMSHDALSRVIQGVVTGIGFIGAGSILKLEGERDIRGLTTAAGVWMAAAIGVCVGVGSIGIGALATVLAVIILAVVGAIEGRAQKDRTEVVKHSKSKDGD